MKITSRTIKAMQRFRLYLIPVIITMCGDVAMAQGSAGSDATIESRYLIDLPTAGMLPHGGVAFDAEFVQSGGMLAGVSVGLFGRLMAGISYGGADVIGEGSPDWNPSPGFLLRARLLEETVPWPAIAIGFSSQGKELYLNQTGRYTIKSMGAYIVASKNYKTAGFLGLHGGANYSFERDDGDTDINFFVGIEKTIGPFLSVLGEYNLGMNDSNKGALGRGRGYVNTAVKASIGNGLSLSFALKDLAQNQQDIRFANRIFQLEYEYGR